MATDLSKFSHNERNYSSDSDDQTAPKNDRSAGRVSNGDVQPRSGHPRPGQHLDDADLLAWKRQYMNMASREQNVVSSSADDLTQLVDHIPLANLSQGYEEGEDDELHLEDGTFDYETSIRERLIKANEDLKQDQTPAELRHKQRVSFDAIVKAVDIEQDPQELQSIDSPDRQPIPQIVEETSTKGTSPQNENNVHEYTVPLNDTQPREGPTLTEAVKAMQFHGVMPSGGRWSSTMPNPTSHQDNSPSNQSNLTHNRDVDQPLDMTGQPLSSSGPQRSMLVAINGGFELQNEDDYTAKGGNQFSNGQTTKAVGSRTGGFVPRPPTEEKKTTDSSKPPRPYPTSTRPKSSDATKRTDYSSSSAAKSWSGNNPPRAKSAGLTGSLTLHKEKKSSSNIAYFAELNKKAAEEKRAKERAERQKQEDAEAERQEQLKKAQESFEKWVRDKDFERKRLSEEKRLEKEEHDAREAQCEKELAELREKKYQDWITRKNREVTLANEFKKLQESDAELASGGGSNTSLQKLHQKENHRAFQRWLRRKYEQSREEKRQLRAETRRLRRRQRRSIKRFQLHQDLQLARAFGYS